MEDEEYEIVLPNFMGIGNIVRVIKKQEDLDEDRDESVE